jgi:hypothetical protein
VRRRWLLGIVLLAAALRVYPLHVFYLHPDQESVPRMALASFLAGDWRPQSLVYPSGLMTTLRAAYTATYAVGRIGGAYRDRLDLVGDFAAHPFHFLFYGRAWACVLGIATVPLTARLGTRLFGPGAGLLGALFLAVGFLHVRESHYGSLDAPAVAFLVGTLVAAETFRRTGRRASLLAAGLLAGAATAYRHQLALALLALPAAELAAAGPRPGRSRRLALGAAAALGAFALLSPYVLLEPLRAWRDLRGQLGLTFALPGPASLSLATAFAAAVGVPMCGLALVGLAAALRGRHRGVLVLLAVAVPYLVALARAERLFVRYTLPLVPLLAVLAAHAVLVLRERMPRRTGPVLAALLVLVTVADPAGRSVALVRLLARDDTRLLAGQWIAAHVPSGAALIVPGTRWYSLPELPPSWGDLAWRYGSAAAAELRRRGWLGDAPQYRLVAYGYDGSGFAAARTRARWVVTAEHPGLPAFGLVPTPVADALRTQGTRLVEFVAVDADPGEHALFCPIDANYVPLRGFGTTRRPGPTITVWRLDGAPPGPAR